MSRLLHPASRTFLLLARFWRSRERLCMNRVRSLLNMRCMLPRYSLEPKPNMPDLAAILVFHGTAGSIITIGLSLNGRSHWKNRFDERKQDWLGQKFGLRRHQRVDAIWAEPTFLLLSKEKDKRRLCLQGAIVGVSKQWFSGCYF